MTTIVAPPAKAGGIVVSGSEPALTCDGAPTTPGTMVRSDKAIRDAHANHDAQRTNSKVRLTPARMAELDDLVDALGFETRAALIYHWIDEAKAAAPKRRRSK